MTGKVSGENAFVKIGEALDNSSSRSTWHEMVPPNSVQPNASYIKITAHLLLQQTVQDCRMGVILMDNIISYRVGAHPAWRRAGYDV